MGGMYMDNFLYSSLQITQYSQYWRSQCEMTVNKTEDEMGRFQHQDSQEFKRDKKFAGIFDHARDSQSLSVLSVIYGDGVTRCYQNSSAVELSQKISKLECPRQTLRTTTSRHKMEKAYDINTYRAVHRPSTTTSFDVSVGNFKPHLYGSTNVNYREPLSLSYRGTQSNVHAFQSQRNRSLILSEEDKSHLTVVCQPLNSSSNSSYNKHPSTRPLWSRNWRKEPTDSTSAFEELQFSPNYPVNGKCSFDSTLTPQIMACFISPDEVNEMSQRHKNSHCQSIESLTLKSEDSRILPVDQVSEDEQNEKEDKEEKSEGIGVDGEDSDPVPLFDMDTAYCASDATKADDEVFTANTELELDDNPGETEKDLTERNNDNADVDNKDNEEEEAKGDNEDLHEFDSKSNEIPAYLFKEPLPYPLNKLDINQMSREKVNWRDVVRWHSVDPLMHSILDRLFEIDQLQHETEENEIRKALTKQAMRMKSRSMNSRQVTSVTLKLSGREKQCTENCLQSVAVNDSPDKQRLIPSLVCHSCYQSLFGRNDQEEYSYDQQSRLPADKELWRNLATSVTSVPTVAIRPRSCNVNHPRHSPNRLSLTPSKGHRPKSSTVSSCTFSQETASQKQSKDSFEGLVIDLKTPISRPKSTIPKQSVIKCKGSRHILFPGKGYHSTERNSVTNPDNQDSSLIVDSQRSDRKVKKKDKRNLTSSSLLDL